jgi:hypothetical protein
MNWKSTAVVSGITVLAGWLAKDTGLYRPIAGVAPPSSETPRVAAAVADVQREANRLHLRLQQAGGYHLPQRNPFRFHTPPAAPQPSAARPGLSEPLERSELPEPPTVRLILSGIAEDRVGEQVVRTAVISTPTDVLLLKEGEQIGDQYKVDKIDAATIDLIRLSDGTSLRLSLRP